jgi:putative transposase
MLRSSVFRAVAHCFPALSLVVFDSARLALLAARSQKHAGCRKRRADDSTRWMMAALSRVFLWRDALVNVKPDALI